MTTNETDKMELGGNMLDGRPWLSQFDIDWYEFEENKQNYPCIQPVHLSELWACAVRTTTGTHRARKATLKEAVDFVRETVAESGTDKQKRAINV